MALCHLVSRLRERGFSLFDTQMVTAVTRQLGAIEVSRTDYLARLGEALKREVKFR